MQPQHHTLTSLHKLLGSQVTLQKTRGGTPALYGPPAGFWSFVSPVKHELSNGEMPSNLTLVSMYKHVS